MTQRIFVNLPVEDLDRSKRFFEALGFAIEQRFTNEQAACVVVSEAIFVMLLTKPFFRLFTPRTIADAGSVTEVLTCLSADSRVSVDSLVEAALAAGGSEIREPQEHGSMYGRSFADPDGHIWEVMWMEEPAEAV